MSILEQNDAETSVATVRSAFARPAVDLRGVLRSVYPLYRECVERVNRELQHCVKLHRRGLTAEAIHRAEEEHLLDLATILDVPEWDQWATELETLDIAPGERVDADSAAALNRLYGPQKRVETLLRRNRFLALSRAPLNERLEVMRRISEEQPDNATLKDDIKQFERARLESVLDEIRNATDRGDRVAIEAIAKELVQTTWTLRPNPQLLELAKSSYQRLLQRDARQRMADLSSDLQRAWMEKRIDTGKALWKQWQRWEPHAKLPADHDSLKAAGEAVHWIQRELAQEAAASELTGLLGEGEHLFENRDWRSKWKHHREELAGMSRRLDRATARVSEFGIEPSDDQQRRLSLIQRHIGDRREEMSRLERSSRAMAMTIVSGLVAVGCVVAWQVHGAIRYRNELAQHVSSLEKSIDAGDRAGTAAYLERLSDPLKAEPQLAELIGRHEESVKAEDDRRSHVQSLAETVRDAISDEKRSTGIPALQARVAELRKAALTPAEQLLANDAERALIKKSQELETAADEAFVKRLTNIREQLAMVKPGDIEGLRRIDGSLVEMKTQDGVSAELKTTVKTLTEANQIKLTTWQADRDDRRLVETAAAATGNWLKYKQILQDYVMQLPQRARAQDFQIVLREDQDVGAGIDAWNTAMEELSSSDLTKLEPAAAKLTVSRLKLLLTTYPEHPSRESARRIIRHLEAIEARRDASGSKLEDSLQTVLDNRLLSRMFMLSTKDGKRFYGSDAPMPRGVWFDFSFYISGDFTDVATRKFRDEDVNIPGTQKIDWLSPQYQLAMEARAMLERINDANWDREFIGLLERVYSDRLLDPVLKYQLLELIAGTATKGSFPAQIGLERFTKHLARARFDRAIDVVSAADPAGTIAREEALEWLKGLPSPKDALPLVAAAHAEFRQPKLTHRTKWIGLLIKDQEDHWAPTFPRAAPDESGMLYLVIRGKDGIWEFEGIGEMIQGREQLNAPSARWVQGRPVFVGPGIPGKNPSVAQPVSSN